MDMSRKGPVSRKVRRDLEKENLREAGADFAARIAADDAAHVDRGPATPTKSCRIMRRREVLDRLGIGQSTLYYWIKRGKFPRPLPLGSKLVGWPEDVVDGWIAARAADVEE